MIFTREMLLLNSTYHLAQRQSVYVTFHPITFSNIRKAYMIQLVEVFVTVQQQIFFPTIKENCQLIVLLQMV